MKKDIQETKEKIIDSLEGINRAEKLADDYIEMEKELLKELSKLKNWSLECDCDDINIINTIHEGDEPEISSYCLNCGGYVDGA